MFLLVSGRHVGAHPAGHQHDVYIQISINLSEILLGIARELKTAETWFLARLFLLQSSIISKILEFIYWTVTIFSFDHINDENREYYHLECYSCALWIIKCISLRLHTRQQCFQNTTQIILQFLRKTYSTLFKTKDLC